MKALQPFHLEHTGLEPGVTLIEASAGTGKTFTIAGIVLRLVLELRIPIEQILTVTYTVAATEELRDRVRKRLRNALDDLRLGSRKMKSWRSISRATTLSKASATSIWRCRISMTRGFLPFTPSASASCAIMPSRAACCSTPSCSPIPRRSLRKRREDFWRQHFYSGSALLPRLAMANDRSPKQWIDRSGKRSTIQTWSLSLLRQPKPAAEIGKQIEKKLAEVAAAWSKSSACRFPNTKKPPEPLSRQNQVELRTPGNPPDRSRLAGGVPPIFGRPTPNPFARSRACRDQRSSDATKPSGTAPRHPFFDLCEDFRDLTSRYFHQLDHEFIDFAHQEIPKRKARLNVLTYDDLLTRLRDALIARDRAGARQSARCTVSRRTDR